ncbi:hypothetical protein GGR54DRAFT_623278 [Hypoxylon sp. NC1633]|nr:hypothetical protein GGR54DRAFT_623278 [Hypoxylon sp. NC1633]
MMSKSGSLPRIEGPSLHFRRAYALYSLIRSLEKGGITLLECLDQLEKMFLYYHGISADASDENTFNLSYTDTVHRHLIGEMNNPVHGGVWMQSALDASKSIAERIWRCAVLIQETDLLGQHLCWKFMRQGTMSSYHAKIMLDLTSRENFSIIQDEGVGYKENYFLMGRKTRFRVDYVVEATGLEYDVNTISSQSPILRRMIQKELVDPDSLGGIRVGFANNKAGPDIYAIGSLTKGTHHFVADIERIASHALRISDSLVGLQPSQPVHVALFVDRDFFSTVILMDVVPKLLVKGHMPFIFLLDKPDRSIYLPDDEREYHFFESLVVPQVIIPHCEAHGGPPQVTLTTSSAENEYGILVEQVKDINDPGFLASLGQYHIDIGILIGSEVKAEEDLRESCRLYQLKAGYYPSYQSIRQVLEQGGSKFGYSLENLSENPECDGLLSTKERSITKAPCVFSALLNSSELGVELAVEAIDRFSRGTLFSTSWRNLTTLSNGRGDGGKRSLKLIDIRSIIGRVVAPFTTAETRKRLLDVIIEELRFMTDVVLDIKDISF